MEAAGGPRGGNGPKGNLLEGGTGLPLATVAGEWNALGRERSTRPSSGACRGNPGWCAWAGLSPEASGGHLRLWAPTGAFGVSAGRRDKAQALSGWTGDASPVGVRVYGAQALSQEPTQGRRPRLLEASARPRSCKNPEIILTQTPRHKYLYSWERPAPRDQRVDARCAWVWRLTTAPNVLHRRVCW